MDNLFVFSKEALEDPYNDDFRIMRRELERICPANLDFVMSTEEDDDKYIFERFNKNIRLVIPVGDLDFVKSYLGKEDSFDKDMKPIEIPCSLHRMVGRKYFLFNGSALKAGGYADASKWFIKNTSKLKKWNSKLYDGDVSRFIEDEDSYSVSEKMKILSEYRVFVLRNEITAVQRYDGDPLVFPNGSTIEEMVRAYGTERHPRAYTLDVAVIDKGRNEEATIPLEIHPFVACGLYGYLPEHLNLFLEGGYTWYRYGF